MKLIFALYLLFTIFFPTNALAKQDTYVFSLWQGLVEEVYSNFDGHEIESGSLLRNQIYDTLGYAFYEKFVETGNEHFFVLALNELNNASRQSILSKHNTAEFSELTQLHIKRRVDRYYDVHLFEKRPFSLSDIYLFHYVPVERKDFRAVEELLTYWRGSLNQIERNDPVLASLMALTISYGYFRINSLAQVTKLVPNIQAELHVVPSHYLLNAVRRVVYAIQQQGHYLTSLRFYNDALIPISHSIFDIEEYLRTKIDYASILYRIGYVLDAKRVFEYVHGYDLTILDERHQTALQNNLAIAYLNTGNFDQYIQLQLEAYELALEAGNKEYQLVCLRNLYIFHRRNNDHQLAYEYLMQAQRLALESSLDNELPIIIKSLGVYYREVENDLIRAESYQKEAIELAKTSSNFQNIRNAKIELSETYRQLNRFGDAISVLETLSADMRERQDETGYVEIKSRMAWFNILAGNHNEAHDIISQFDRVDFSRLIFEEKVLPYNVLVFVYLDKGYLAEALNLSSEIVFDIIDWLKESADIQTGRLRMEPSYLEAFQIRSKLYAEMGMYREMIRFHEEIRNISKSALFNNPLLKSSILSGEQLNRDFNLRGELQQLRNDYRLASEEGRVIINNRILELKVERNKMLAVAANVEYEIPENFSLSAVQSNLKKGQTVIYKNIFNSTLYSFVITKSDVHLETIEFNPVEEAFVGKVVQSLHENKVSLKDLHRIYKTYYKDLIPDETQELILIPDGIFYSLPVEILPLNEVNSATSFGSAEYLLERYVVSYSNALVDITAPERAKKIDDFETQFAGFGVTDFSHMGENALSPLVFASTEISSAKSALGSLKNVQVFLNDNSTELTFREKAGETAIIHLATHSKISQENPLFSVIHFSNENGNYEYYNDGLVHVYELFEMNLSSQLIFLSSCESGTGQYLQGIGILGFSRALSYSGAESIIMNLWPVRDKTSAKLASSFYSYLNDGFSKSEALRQARLDYLNSVNSNPYLWGSLVLFGNTEPVISTGRYNRSLVILSFLIATGLIGMLLWQRFSNKS